MEHKEAEKRGCTLAEIARRAGVSRQVVGAILNPERQTSVRFSRETREKVMAVVKASGWRPNRTAVNLVKRRHGNIGVLVQKLMRIPEKVLNHMLMEAHEQGQVLVLDYLAPEGGEPPVCVKEDSVDAVVVFEDLDPQLWKAIRKIGLPCIQVNSNNRRGPGCVTFDEEGAMRTAVQHFHKQGCHRTALFHAQDREYWTVSRIRALREAAKECGMREPMTAPFELDFFSASAAYERARNAMKHILLSNPDVDSAILMRSEMAPLFYQAAEDAGRRIPDDLAVIGMHDSTTARAVRPELTVLHVESHALAKHIMRVVNAGLDSNGLYEVPQPARYELRARQSSVRSGLTSRGTQFFRRKMA
jgi:DNA-binding LacI/PurR family transcriptional regulator